MDQQDVRSRPRRAFLKHGIVVASALALGAGAANAGPRQDDDGRGTIQSRIDEASSGDTVEIESGEYTGSIVIDKPLTLRAASRSGANGTGGDRTTADEPSSSDTTTTDGAGDGTSGNATAGDASAPQAMSAERPTIDATGRKHGIVIEASDVSVEGFEVVGDQETASGISVSTDESELSGITISDNRLSGMEGSAGSGGRQAFGILSFGTNVVSDLTVTGNVVEDLGGKNKEDPQGVGINLQSIDGDEPGAGGVVAGNEVRGMADGNLDVSFDSPSGFDRAVPPFGVALTVQPLDGNESDANSDGVIAYRNSFEDNSVDVVLGNRSDPMTSVVKGNNFGGGDDFGLVNVGESVPADCNYWGHSSGPSHGNNLSGGGDIVLGKVDYRPWAKEAFEEVGRVAVGAGQGRGNATDAGGNETFDRSGNVTSDGGNATGSGDGNGTADAPLGDELSCSGGETTGEGG
jgi:hypothetical protein